MLKVCFSGHEGISLAKRRRITAIFLMTVLCSLCVFVGFNSRLDKFETVFRGQRALKATGLEEEEGQYVAYFPVPKKVEEIFAGLKESRANTAIRELLLSCLQDIQTQCPDKTQTPTPENENPSPRIYIVTPTYRRPEQIPELTRMGQTIRQVKNIHWIVAEDAETLSLSVQRTVEKMGIPHTLLVAPMPKEYASARSKPRGVSNRNAAIQWLRNNNIKDGVLYFADDDNSYDLELFSEIRKTKKVGMWPVGLLTKFGLSSPIVKNGTVVDFYDGWRANRKFPVDMAGFAVNVGFLSQFPNISMPYTPGYEETGFLRGLNISKSDIEPLADNCTKILVWHTQTKKNKEADKSEASQYDDTNIPALMKQIL